MSGEGLRVALAARKISKQGQKRATTYFAGGAKAARGGKSDGRIDTELLDLKIRDLGGTPPASPEET